MPMQPAMRARLERSIEYHTAMAKAYGERAEKANGGQSQNAQGQNAQGQNAQGQNAQGQNAQQQGEEVERYRPETEQGPGEEVAGGANEDGTQGRTEPTAPEHPGSEIDEQREAVTPQAQQGSRAEVSRLQGDAKLAELHQKVAERLSKLLVEDIRPGIAQARNQRPLMRDPAMAAAAMRARLRPATPRPPRERKMYG